MTVHFIGLRSDALLRFILFVYCSCSTLECLIVLSAGIIRVTQEANFSFDPFIMNNKDTVFISTLAHLPSIARP